MNTKEYKEIINNAIRNELEAYEFYKSAAGKSVNTSLKQIFTELAGEELKHKQLLDGFIKDTAVQMNFSDSDDYKISESLPLPKLTTTMSYTEGIALAMKKEEEAMLMYQKLSESCTNQEQKNTFIQLSKMEKMHKTRLENLYSSTAYNEVW